MSWQRKLVTSYSSDVWKSSPADRELDDYDEEEDPMMMIVKMAMMLMMMMMMMTFFGSHMRLAQRM